MLPPNSDPALSYIYDAVHYYGYDPKNRLEIPDVDREAFREALHKRIAKACDGILPHMTRAGLARLFNLAPHTISEALGVTKHSAKCDSMRLLLLHLMVHVMTIRDTLADQERELWALWLQTNDPRANPLMLEPPQLPKGPTLGNRARAILKKEGIEPPPLKGRQPFQYQRKYARKRRLEAIMAQKKPLPGDAMLPQILPFRALQMLGVEASNSNPYAVKHLTDHERELKAIAGKIWREKTSQARKQAKEREKADKLAKQTYDETEPGIMIPGSKGTRGRPRKSFYKPEPGAENLPEPAPFRPVTRLKRRR